jgi:4-hydroxy-tetrahydrodipicolinate synthase
MFDGSFVALVTPLRNGGVDLPALRDLVRFHLENGTAGIVPVGTTGEAPTLEPDERAAVVRTVVEACGRKIPVVAGTGTNSTKQSIALTRQAKDLGADGALVVAPYYNKPSQEGLFRHFEAVAREGGLPVVLYNVPGRTSVSIAPETVARLAKVRGVAAIKESSGSLETVTQIRLLCDLPILSGEDALNWPILTAGGKGAISVLANILPREVADLCAAAAKGDGARGLALHEKLFPLAKALFLETNPVPVKTALQRMGRTAGEVRLPLCEMSPASAAKLDEALRAYGLLR